MIYIYINNKIKTYETDIRDLCMAFFPYQKLNFLYEDSINVDEIKDIKKDKSNILIDNYFDLNENINIKNRYKIKNQLKRSLYQYLNKLTKKQLPWGALTGIRPVNIGTQILEFIKYGEDNKSDTIKQFKDYLNENFDTININDNKLKQKIDKKLIIDYLKYEYLISDEKANLILDIAKYEVDILHKKNTKDFKNGYSIYIGVPFCKSTCLYCSFTSFNIDKWSKYVDKYLDKLEFELKNKIKKLPNNKKLMTIYVGGGTPTSLSDEQFNRFLNIIYNNFDTKNIIEWTVEAGRPDTINEFKLKKMLEFGVNRISINPQTFNQKTLDLIGRKHTTYDIIDKFNLARSIGFKNINMDIILGLPNEKLEDVINTLVEVGKLNPDSLTVHSLALKRAARLNVEKEDWQKQYLAGLALDGEIEKMNKCSAYLASLLDLKPYYLYRQKNIAGNLENIGFAKKNKECLYNIFMMSERHSVYGFGCGASTKIVKYLKSGEKIVERIDGLKSVVDYCERD